MNLLFSIDDGYVRQFQVTLYSLIKNSSSRDVQVHVLQKTQLLAEAQPFALKSDKQKASYLGGMVAQYGARAYKFERGTFKIYFVMTTNCVQLVDRVVANAGLDIVTNSGILTPGAYQAYLDKEFANPHSRVVSKMVLGRQTP